MRHKLEQYLNALKAAGLDPEREARLRAEMETAGEGHGLLPPEHADRGEFAGFSKSPYAWHDMAVLQDQETLSSPYAMLIKSLDELLERDRQREADGFPRK